MKTPEWILLEGDNNLKVVKVFNNYSEAIHFYKGYKEGLGEYHTTNVMLVSKVLESEPEPTEVTIKKFPWIEDTIAEEKPTPKQLETIKMIEENTGVKFEGKTLTEASSFIGDNIERSKEARRNEWLYLQECNATTSDLY